MVQKADGQNYAPQGKSEPVVGPGEFKFAALALDHGHIYGQCNGLREAGAELAKVYDPDPAKLKQFCEAYPEAEVASCEAEILEDETIQLVAAAAIPNLRGPLGCKVMQHGKHYFTDKTPFTQMSQLDEAKKVVAETGKKYSVYYSERLHVECAVHAGNLINDGVIGKVINVIGLGPHRLAAPTRPDWFFDKEQYGGILTDIGSHQFEQFLYYTGAQDAEVSFARVGNHDNPDYPELEDMGEASLVADNGATNYIRVDWFTPDGLSTWGDGRTVIVGTEGTIELRKYLDLARDDRGDHLYLVTGDKVEHMCVNGEVGFPFFGDLVLDCMNGTENAMTQAHTFKAAELCLIAQDIADAARA